MISCPWQTKASISSEMNQREQMGIILFRVEQLSSEGVSFDRVALHVFGPALEVLRRFRQEKRRHFRAWCRTKKQVQMTQACSLRRCIRLAARRIS